MEIRVVEEQDLDGRVDVFRGGSTGYFKIVGEVASQDDAEV